MFKILFSNLFTKISTFSKPMQARLMNLDILMTKINRVIQTEL